MQEVDSRPCLSPTLVIALDAFGAKVVKMLEETARVFPRAIQLGCSFINYEINATTDAITCELVRLTSLENIESIEREGYIVEGRQAQALRPLLLFIWEHDATILASEIIAGVLKDQPALLAVGCCRFRGKRESVSAIPDSLALFVAESDSITGVTLSEKDQLGAFVGFVTCALVCPGKLELASSRGRTAAFGSTCFFGVSGPSLDMLASLAAIRLIKEHFEGMDPKEAERRMPSDWRRFIHLYSKESLLDAMFDPDLANRAEVEAVPATAAFNPGGSISTKLDRFKMEVQLDKVPELEWVKEVTDISRTLDMTLCSKWAIGMDRIRRQKKHEIEKEFLPAFTEMLSSVTYSPVLAKCLLDQISSSLSAEIKAPDPRTDSSSLTHRIQDLALRIEERPNPSVLILRQALWVLPAAYFGFKAFYGKFEGFLGLLPWAWVILLMGLVITWILLDIHSAQKAITKARAAVRDVLHNRLEAIIACNAAGHFRLLQKIVFQQLESSYSVLQKFSDMYVAISASLMTGVDRGTKDYPLTFGPILTTGSEHDALLDDLRIEFSDWSHEAVSDGIFLLLDEQGDLDQHTSRLRDWCKQKLLQNARLRMLSLKDILKFRKDSEVDGKLGDMLDIVARRSKPMSPVDSRGFKTSLIIQLSGEEVGDLDNIFDSVETIAETPLIIGISLGYLPQPGRV